ncbi:hypothetical protein ACE1OE_02510 [Vibrio sp. E150_011]
MCPLFLRVEKAMSLDQQLSDNHPTFDTHETMLLSNTETGERPFQIPRFLIMSRLDVDIIAIIMEGDGLQHNATR